MEIRTIETEDYAEIKVLIQKAFENEEHSDGDEQLLVERIRKEKSYQKEFEVIALINSEIVGHGLLSPIIIEQKESSLIEDAVMALAPLAVKKEYQGKGIGRAIIEELENRAKTAGYQGLSILGDPGYYQRFGYFPAKIKQIEAPFEIESNYFLIKELTENSLENCQGIVRYLPAFGLN